MMNIKNKSIVFFLFFLLSFTSVSQQTYKSARPFMEDFCNLSSLDNASAKDFSNITKWVDSSLNNLFFGIGRNTSSPRNNAGFIQMTVYDNGQGIYLPIFDSLILFNPTARSKVKINENFSRNKYWFNTECELDILSYCNADYVKAFDYSQKAYFKTGAKLLNLSPGDLIANTINRFVEYDYKKETGVQVFTKNVNKNLANNITLADKQNDEFKYMLKQLKSSCSYDQILELLFMTYIEKKDIEETEINTNEFYRSFTPIGIEEYVNNSMTYVMKIGLNKGGVIKVSKDILEKVDTKTKEPIKDTNRFIEIPTNKIDVEFAVDNTPRLTIIFDTWSKNKPLYKLKRGLTSGYISGRFERIKITDENPEYSRIKRVKVIYFNDRIQVFISSDFGNNFQLINERRVSLLPNK